MRRALALSAAGLALAIAIAPAARADGEPPKPPRPAIRTVTGKLTQVERAERRLVIATAEGSLTVTYDRNTAVYLADRMGTVDDLAVGQPVRASFAEEARAFWVEIQSGEGVAPRTAPAEEDAVRRHAGLPPEGNR